MIKTQFPAPGVRLFSFNSEITVKKRNSNLPACFQAEFFQGLMVLVTAGQKRGGETIKATCLCGAGSWGCG